MYICLLHPLFLLKHDPASFIFSHISNIAQRKDYNEATFNKKKKISEG